jgi:hypothetical protein
MKYFQNVVDIVRDLMSPNAEEQHYKNGMRKDPDGFMDIEWCCSKQIHSWDELRKVFQIANGRKAIAPTQFNPMSTRGHCIMTLEVEMPHPETEGMKQRGRVYVCDLAGIFLLCGYDDVVWSCQCILGAAVHFVVQVTGYYLYHDFTSLLLLYQEPSLQETLYTPYTKKLHSKMIHLSISSKGPTRTPRRPRSCKIKERKLTCLCLKWRSSS